MRCGRGGGPVAFWGSGKGRRGVESSGWVVGKMWQEVMVCPSSRLPPIRLPAVPPAAGVKRASADAELREADQLHLVRDLCVVAA